MQLNKKVIKAFKKMFDIIKGKGSDPVFHRLHITNDYIEFTDAYIIVRYFLTKDDKKLIGVKANEQFNRQVLLAPTTGACNVLGMSGDFINCYIYSNDKKDENYTLIDYDKDMLDYPDTDVIVNTLTGADLTTNCECRLNYYEAPSLFMRTLVGATRTNDVHLYQRIHEAGAGYCIEINAQYEDYKVQFVFMGAYRNDKK